MFPPPSARHRQPVEPTFGREVDGPAHRRAARRRSRRALAASIAAVAVAVAAGWLAYWKPWAPRAGCNVDFYIHPEMDAAR